MDDIGTRRWPVILAALGFGIVLAGTLVLITAITPDGRSPGGGQFGRFAATPVPTPVPPLSFQDAKGNPVRLHDFLGRVVLLNLWATWCTPCVREMPSLDRLQTALGGPDFQVIALSQDRSGAGVVLPFLEHHHLQALTAYLDPPGLATQALGSEGLPTTLLIGRDGREVGRMLGSSEWDTPMARHLIESLIAVPKTSPAESRP